MLGPIIRCELPALRRLSVRGLFADDLCGLLVGARFFPQLTSLDLSGGHFSDVGAEALLAHADKLGALELLDVRSSSVSLEGCARLAAVCSRLRRPGDL